MSQYTHFELNRDIEAPSGYYTPEKEIRLNYDGREVLCIINHTVISSSCCGLADFISALVPGYILQWQADKNKDGLPVSIVEPISDRLVQEKIRETILESEHVSEMEFW